jgi:KipI family sensor histidine kinase inhibitor
MIIHACSVTGVVVDDVVVGAHSVVVTHTTEVGEAVRAILHDESQRTKIEPSIAPQHSVEIFVRYDGDDLDFVAEQCGITTREVISLHTSVDFTVEFCGFAPGFAYLIGLPSALILPRRATPRPRVTAGSVAIAAHYSAVYPRESPGGWHVLGNTTHDMWDIDRRPPAVLQPGMRVRFVELT